MDFVKEMQGVLGGTGALSPIRVSDGHIYSCCVFLGSLDGADWILCQTRDIYAMSGSLYVSHGSAKHPDPDVPQAVLEAIGAL